MTAVEIGMKFTRLTIVSKVDGYSKYNCVCDCGAEVIITKSTLIANGKKSCGCLKRDSTIARNLTHGMSKRPEYSNWKGIIKRCFNPNDKRNKDYMSRGISVHEGFIKSFPAWLEEIGPKPDDGQRWSVGRTDNNGWYTYGNMRWELDTQQAQNHSMQLNNTSGIVGVAVRTTKISGVEYPAWVACWNNMDGKKRTKNFSINKYGNDLAKEMAINFRNKMIEELNSLGAEYADSHGSNK